MPPAWSSASDSTLWGSGAPRGLLRGSRGARRQDYRAALLSAARVPQRGSASRARSASSARRSTSTCLSRARLRDRPQGSPQELGLAPPALQGPLYRSQAARRVAAWPLARSSSTSCSSGSAQSRSTPRSPSPLSLWAAIVPPLCTSTGLVRRSTTSSSRPSHSEPSCRLSRRALAPPRCTPMGVVPRSSRHRACLSVSRCASRRGGDVRAHGH